VAISGLSAATAYYRQVRVFSYGWYYANGGTWWRFNTEGPPAAFTKLLPPDGIPTTSRTLSGAVPPGSYLLSVTAHQRMRIERADTGAGCDRP
jgi:hypothetical protein